MITECGQREEMPSCHKRSYDGVMAHDVMTMTFSRIITHWTAGLAYSDMFDSKEWFINLIAIQRPILFEMRTKRNYVYLEYWAFWQHQKDLVRVDSYVPWKINQFSPKAAFISSWPPTIVWQHNGGNLILSMELLVIFRCCVWHFVLFHLLCCIND